MIYTSQQALYSGRIAVLFDMALVLGCALFVAAVVRAELRIKSMEQRYDAQTREMQALWRELERLRKQ